MASAAVPERSLQQRLDALKHANEIRVGRAQLKRDVAAARVDADLLLSGGPLVDSMKVEDLLRAVPGLGKVKIDKKFRREAISPSKTVGGLSPRQRRILVTWLVEHREGSDTYKRRRLHAEIKRERIS